MLLSIVRNWFLSVFFLFLAPLTAQAACQPPLQGAAYDQAINAGPLNEALFSRAVSYYTNAIRCTYGLPLLGAAHDVSAAAAIQARNMTRTRIYSHTLNVPGARDLRARMRAQNKNFRAAGENISKTFVYVLNGRPYIPAAHCAFRYLSSHQPVPVHSYRSLAQEVVASWGHSPEHLANIVNRRYTRMGAAFGIDPNGQLCGEVYVSQVLAQ